MYYVYQKFCKKETPPDAPFRTFAAGKRRPSQNSREKSVPPHASGRGSAVRPLRLRHRQGRVGAIEELDGRKHQLGVADVHEIVHLELAFPITFMPGLAGLICMLDRRAVLQVLPPAPTGDRRPEIIEHVAVESDPFAGLEADRPHADAVALRHSLGADAAVRMMALLVAFLAEPLRP